MVSTLIPSADLAPSVTSRVLIVKAIDFTEGAPATGSITFELLWDVDVKADGVILKAGKQTLEFDANGEMQIRVPTSDPDTNPDAWFLTVKKSWAPHAYAIRVPVGTTPINLVDVPVVQQLPSSAAPGFFLTGASVTTTEGAQWGATVDVAGGIGNFKFIVPPGGTAWLRGTLANGTDLNSLVAKDQSGLYALSNANTYPNRSPITGSHSTLHVESNGIGVVTQRETRALTGETWERYVTNTQTFAWSAWSRVGDVKPQFMTSAGLDLDALRITTDFIVPSASGTVTGWPSGVARGAAHVQSRATVLGIVFQQIHIYGTSGGLFSRQTANVSSTPFPWTAWRQIDAPPVPPVPSGGSDSGIANAMLIQDFTRRRGGRKRITTGAVALRFDHGLAPFNTKIRPLLEARGLPYSLALNGGNWGVAENTGVTAAMVNSWVQGGLCEIWNHSRTHSGTKDETTWRNEIYQGLLDLRAALPDAQIDGWAMPSLQTLGYGDFFNGGTVQEWYATPAGRYILETHAVATGYIPGTYQRLLDGVPRQGQLHWTFDKSTLPQIQTFVQAAETNKTGLQLMHHPTLTDTADHITLDTVTAILDYIVAERDAGRIKVLGPYDLMLADAT